MAASNSPTNRSDAYDEKSIQLLEGLDAVRKRPGMYIGGTGPEGLHHLVWELIDNAVDEAAAGHANLVEVTLPPTTSIAGRPVRDLKLPRDAALVTILRGGRVIVPQPDEPLEPGDELLFVASTEVEGQVREALR